MCDKPRMMWLARDTDGRGWFFDVQPAKVDGEWKANSAQYGEVFGPALPGIAPGECRMFVEYAPRVADGTEHDVLAWNADEGAWSYHPIPFKGTIILPMPPDPTPYLTHADPKAARREEIRAQIAALQAEPDGMEG